jgi:hypothetical protein
MMAEDPFHRRLHVVRSDEPSVFELDRTPSAVLRVQEEFKPLPSWIDVALVLGICIPFWAGLAWLVTAWL